ncbi:hypothetical protein HpBT0282_11170 [Helicobacter pylori]
MPKTQRFVTLCKKQTIWLLISYKNRLYFTNSSTIINNNELKHKKSISLTSYKKFIIIDSILLN